MSASKKMEVDKVLPELADAGTLALMLVKVPVVDYPSSRAELIGWSSRHLEASIKSAPKPK